MSKKNGRMLKDFLQDGTTNNSSSGFESIPRRLTDVSDPMVRNLLNQAAATATTVAAANNNLPRSRSRSRAAAEAAFSSFQKLLHAVKSLHYNSTPSTLPRSVSRKLLGRLYTKKRSKSSSEEMSSKIVVVTVKVKDILRWKSSRDLVVDNHVLDNDEEESQPLDLVGPADAPTTSNSCSNVSGVSWVESDFTVVTAEELPCYLGNSGDEGKKWDNDNDDGGDNVVVDGASDSEVGPKEDKRSIASKEDTEQQSPISVLDSPFREEVSDEEFPSSFDEKMAKMERSKQRLLQSIQWFENLAGVHEDEETESTLEEEQQEDEPREEEDGVGVGAKSNAYLSRGFCWFKRGKEGLDDKKECIKGMEKEGQWSKFEEERTEVGVELEGVVLSDLLDEILIDFCG